MCAYTYVHIISTHAHIYIHAYTNVLGTHMHGWLSIMPTGLPYQKHGDEMCYQLLFSLTLLEFFKLGIYIDDKAIYSYSNN